VLVAEEDRHVDLEQLAELALIDVLVLVELADSAVSSPSRPSWRSSLIANVCPINAC
jgi:hypothetical protein